MNSPLLSRYEQDYLRAMGRELKTNLGRLRKLDELGPEKAIESAPSPATRNRYRALFNHVMKWGRENGLVTDGFRPYKMERETGARTRRMTPHEEIRLLAAMDDRDMRDAFIAAVDTGLRKGTLFAITFDMVQDGLIHVPASLTKQRQPQTIPLTNRMKNIIMARWDGDSSLKVFEVRDFDRKWNEARKRADVRNLRWHDLRGEFASRLDEAGVSVAVTSALLGHASLAMTQRYLRPRTSQFVDAIAKLGV